MVELTYYLEEFHRNRARAGLARGHALPPRVRCVTRESHTASAAPRIILSRAAPRSRIRRRISKLGLTRGDSPSVMCRGRARDRASGAC